MFLQQIDSSLVCVGRIIVDVFDSDDRPEPPRYFIPENVSRIERWRYTSELSDRVIETIFD